LGLEGEGKDGSFGGKVYEMGFGIRRKDTRVFDKGRVTERQTKGKMQKKEHSNKNQKGKREMK